MADYVLTPNIGLQEPIIGVTSGTNYATYINNSLTLLDQHDHSPGKGVQITPSGMNINSNLTFQGFAATSLASASFSIQSASATLGQTLYVKLGSESVPLADLWYFDGNNQIQLTSNGLTNTGLATLPGESYSAGTFVWKQGTGSTTPADFDIGSLTIRPTIAATTVGVTLTSPSTADYTLTFPTTLPSAQSLVTIDASGNIATPYDVSGGIPASALAANSITDAQIQPGGITSQSLAAQIISAGYIANGTITGTQMSSNINLPGADVMANGKSIITAPSNLGVAPRIAWGVINSSGSPVSGTGFTSSYLGGNNYNVTFSGTGFTATPAIVMSGTYSGVFPNPTIVNSGGFDFTVTGTITSSDGYSFIAIGV